MKKITVGFVIQEFNDDGKCLSSQFVAGDQVDWEDDDGNSIEPIANESYHPLEMVQPTQTEGFKWITDRVPSNRRTVHLNVENQIVVAGFWDKCTKTWMSLFSGELITTSVFGWSELQLNLTNKESYHSIDWLAMSQKQKD